MPVKLHKQTLQNEHFQFNAIAFVPENPATQIALFTHGYTASKADCLNWAQRLSDANITSVIFDLPGHHLGSYNEIPSLQVFKDHAHECFETSFSFLKTFVPNPETIILGGHSLGALLAVHALELPCFENLQKLAVCIGLGISQHTKTHLFETSFYEKTLNIRRQLVDEKIDSDAVFSWIKEDKLNIQVKNQRIHMITGLDDVVVGEGGMEAMAFHLKSLNNNVTTLEPKKLSHHEPALAASHIYAFIKKELNL